MGISIKRRKAFFGKFQDEWQGCIIEGLGRRDGNGAGHIGDAIVDDAIDLEGRMGVGRRSRGLEAAALIDGHIDENGALFHVLQHRAR